MDELLSVALTDPNPSEEELVELTAVRLSDPLSDPWLPIVATSGT
jgi:hypothetical protein